MLHGRSPRSVTRRWHPSSSRHGAQITVSATSENRRRSYHRRDKIRRVSRSPTPWQRLPADLADGDAAAAWRRPCGRSPTPSPRRRPAFAAIEDAKFERDVRTAVQVALERFLDLVGTDEPALPPPVREVFVALGAAEAREDRGPEVLLAALRMASRLMLRTASRGAGRGAAGGHRGAHRPVRRDHAPTSTSWPRRAPTASPCSCASRPARATAAAGSSPSCCCAAARRPSVVARRGGRHRLARRSTPSCPCCCRSEQARDARFRYGADGVVVERGARRGAAAAGRPARRPGPSSREALRGRGRRGRARRWAGPQVPGGGAAGRADRRAGRRRRPGRRSSPTTTSPRWRCAASRARWRCCPPAGWRRSRGLRDDASGSSLLATLHSWLRHWGSRADGRRRSCSSTRRR